MNVAALFIRRPVTTILVMAGMVAFGTLAYRELPVSDLPTIDYPTIQVSAALPGASPETMAASVALPLEKQFATIAGLDAINSTSSLGFTNIALQFELNRNIDAAAQDVQSMISKTTRQLPAGMPAPPSYQKVNPNDQPIMQLVLYSDTLPLSMLAEYAETTLGQQISMVSGVASVQLIGAARYAVRVDVDPRRLAAHGIGIDEVADAIASANANLPTGTMFGSHRSFSVPANGGLTRASGYGPVIVAQRNGNPVRLDEVARVYDGVENDKTGLWFHAHDRTVPAVGLYVIKQPGTNVVAVADAVKKLIPTLQASLPPAVVLEIRSDRSLPIRESVADVKLTLIVTVCLVVLVIFLFLRNLSATFIPSLALPTSIVATFAVMYQLGYTLDNLSLMALTLCVGFVVDDAIVMLENIVRHLEMGKTPMEAAYDGSKEITFTIVSMTLSLVAVFIPVLFMGGLLGRLLHEFAITIAVTILVSGFVSISLTPMLCSRFLKPAHSMRHGWLYMLIERMFDLWLRAYGWTLGLCLRWRALAMIVSIALIGVTVHLFMAVPKGFLPAEDTGRFNVLSEGPLGTSFDDMVKHQAQVIDVFAQEKNVQSFGSIIGFGPMNQARMIVDLIPRSERNVSVEALMASLRTRVAGIPGIRVFMVNFPPINLGGAQGSRSLYQFTLQDADLEELYRSAPEFERRMRQLPMLDDVSSDLQLGNPEVRLELDRDKISTLGLTTTQVESALYNAYGTRQVSQILAANNQYQVILQVAPEFQEGAGALSMLYVRSKANRLVPVETLTKVSTNAGPQTISHNGQLPSVTISFNLKPGVSLGNAVTEIQSLAANTLPASMSTKFQGTAQAFQSSLQGLGMILAIAIVVIYIVLGILYESFAHPLTILSGLPSAGLGALLTLMLFHSDLNLYSFVGVIMLVGIVKKNGIMMVDFAVAAQAQTGKGPVEAIHEACLVRFRPIMMTTMSALVGTLPIALGWGAGAESRRPLGLAVVGGLLVSQVLTLYITPVYYVYIEKARQWLTRPARRTSPAAVDAVPPGKPHETALQALGKTDA